MTFSSVLFLHVFFAALLCCYFAPFVHKRDTKNTILLLFSLAFYACGGLAYFPLILLSIAINYLFGRLVDGCGEVKKKKCLLAVAVALNLLLLFCFKYLGFLTENLNLLIPTLPVLEIVLPIGISFYTFQGLSYVVDVYRGEAKGEKNLVRVALYIALFPQLVAGPIVRYTTIADEISVREESWDEAYAGAVRFLLGFAKKILLANPLGQMADSAFSQSGDLLTTGLAWLGALAYTGQIYFDFSGYSDMAIGLGRLFGFHFLENFNYPYISKSVTEFWRRWHISLSTWFRDYVYIPLGGNRGNRAFQIRNLAIVWMLTGIWHGAEWTFILWGVYYALLLIGERYCWGKALEKCPALLRHGYAMVLVIFGWVIFRAPTLSAAWNYSAAMLGLGSAPFWCGQASYLLRQYWVELIFGVVFALPTLPKAKEWLLSRGEGMSRAVGLASPALLLVLFGLAYISLLSSGFNPFIYFQF
ncbi:MAG: MBOAT family protein [Oscillospiraceae bacterium]|nr:MBOAT family protein [Oscillospiraceae bacterium]